MNPKHLSVSVTEVTPKGYSVILGANIREERNPAAAELWQHAAAMLLMGADAQAISDLMRRAKAVSSLYRARSDGGYDVL